jgi:4-hydroxythreonine-4-phosphate dehydrogenase
MGDPAGIGPDIALGAWQSRLSRGSGPFFVIGAPSVFRARAELLGLSSAIITEISAPEEAASVFTKALPVLSTGLSSPKVEAGQPDTRLAPEILKAIEDAVALTLQGRAAAVVTNPIAKYVLLRHGFAHTGHTEFLGELAERHGYKEPFPVMLMASKLLMVAPVTVHIPLKQVPIALTAERLRRTAEVMSRDLTRYFGISKPRIAVCGLNPHAGEAGELGREEIDIIAPVIEELRRQGLQLSGPHSADSLFHEEARQGYDAVLAMYHDQALIPFKALSFYDGVNVTLGLPFIRTSPDHGTAYSLAGTGRASPQSLIEAIKLAARMYKYQLASTSAIVP